MLLVVAVTMVAACGKGGGFRHTDPDFSLPLPKGYHADGEPKADELGRQTLRLTDGGAGGDILLMWGKAKPDAKTEVDMWRQVQKLELKDATPVEQKIKPDGTAVLLHYKKGDVDVLRVAITAGDWVVRCTIEARAPSPALLGACKGLAAGR
jgi:hypothetical protein